MRILLDSCVWGGAKSFLADMDFDVTWVGDMERDPGDLEILETAFRENRILVTLDKDFGELAIIRKIPHHGIIRLVGFRAREQAPICAEAVKKYYELLMNGGIVTMQPGRARIKLADK